MLQILIGVFLFLHGLVHFWYFTLSQRLVAYQPEMGWTGKSWLLSRFVQESTLRTFTSMLFVLAALAFMLGSLGVIFRADWSRPVLIGAALFSTTILILFWDGSGDMLVQKGIVGIALNLVILMALLLFPQQSLEMIGRID